MKRQRAIVLMAGLLAAGAFSASANASNMVVLVHGGQSGGIISSDKIVGVFSVGPEGGDSRGRIDYTVQAREMDFIMAAIETNIIVPVKPDGDGREAAKFPDNDEGPRFKGPIDHQVIAGNFPLVPMPAGHMSEGGASPA